MLEDSIKIKESNWESINLIEPSFNNFNAIFFSVCGYCNFCKQSNKNKAS